MVNNISVRGRDQVMLKVTVAEVQRDVVKQLGINLSGSLAAGTSVVNFNIDNPFTASGQPLSNTSIVPSFGGLNCECQGQYSRHGARRRHAHARRTKPHGDFRRNRELPCRRRVPGAGGSHLRSPDVDLSRIQIQWKKFGVGLAFTPVVLSEGRISLKVGTEVSELSSENAVQLSGLSIPSLRVRRAETTVEIPSGGSLAMAGMIQEQTKQQINGVPGLMNLPVLGTLFKSRDYINRQTELVVLVTPYVVRAVAQKDVAQAGRRLRRRLRRLRHVCSAASTSSTASRASPIRSRPTAATTASFSTDARDEETIDDPH